MAAGLYDITNEILGKGHFAIVKLARHCLTGEHVAVKIVDKIKLTKEGLEQLSCEIKLWSILSRHEHPNVVKLYQCIDTRTKLYLVMEYCGNDVCDLYDHIQKKNDGNGLDEEEARQIFRQICQAIYYCHSLKIVHRDLKPENILIINNQDKNSTNNLTITVKLIDFGFSNQWCEDELLRTSCGSLAYSAPEILLGNQYDGPKVDIWALGCILYILLYGRNPFMQFNDNETLIKILDCSFETPVKSSVNELAVDLIRCLLRKDPMTRSSIQELIAHPWMREKNHKVSNDFGRKESRFKNFVNEHIIDQMITQGISVSKEMIKKILKNEIIETVSANSETTENASLENDNSTVIDHHYIKATYHLLKDKSNREFKGIDINQQLKSRQNKRGNITRKRDLIGKRSDSVDTGRMNRLNSTIEESEIAETTTMTTSLSNSFINTQSLTNLEIPVSNLSSQYVLPLARKCSIVSEEGSICNDDKGAQENSVNSLINFHQKNLSFNSNNNFNLNNSNSINTQSHSINIFVTDSSSNILKPVQIKSNDRTTPTPSLTISPARTKSDRSSILHPVSSSPDLKENLNEYYQSNNTAVESGIGSQGTTTNILFDAVCLNRASKNHQSIIINNNNNNSNNSNNNNVDKKNAIHVLNPSNSSEINHYNQQSSLTTPSMRVIIQSKSLNNIAFLEHPTSDIETSTTNADNATKSDGRNNGSKMINSLSTMNIKSSKTDKNDCCIIV